MKKKTQVLCPNCGAEFATADKEFTTVATVIGKDSGLGTVYPALAEQKQPVKLPKTAQERIDALRKIGADVSNLFAMHGANGGEYVASNKDGKLAILEDNDPLFDLILSQGTVPNHRLYRRWVMAQMFRMMSRSRQGMDGVTAGIHALGYEYQWKMLLDELHAQQKMEVRDVENFADRNRWFNAHVVATMAEDYIKQLRKRVDALPGKKCKGIPYKRIGRRNIFVSDLQSKLFTPLHLAAHRIHQAKNISQLYLAAQKFNAMRIRMAHNTPQIPAWVDAYKGAGAYFTAQNLIRFHNCTVIDDAGRRLDKFQSLAFLSAKAEAYKYRDGWRLLAFLKKMLADNNINIKKKMAQWHKK